MSVFGARDCCGIVIVEADSLEEAKKILEGEFYSQLDDAGLNLAENECARERLVEKFEEDIELGLQEGETRIIIVDDKERASYESRVPAR